MGNPSAAGLGNPLLPLIWLSWSTPIDPRTYEDSVILDDHPTETLCSREDELDGTGKWGPLRLRVRCLFNYERGRV